VYCLHIGARGQQEFHNLQVASAHCRHQRRSVVSVHIDLSAFRQQQAHNLGITFTRSAHQCGLRTGRLINVGAFINQHAHDFQRLLIGLANHVEQKVVAVFLPDPVDE